VNNPGSDRLTSEHADTKDDAAKVREINSRRDQRGEHIEVLPAARFERSNSPRRFRAVFFARRPWGATPWAPSRRHIIVMVGHVSLRGVG